MVTLVVAIAAVVVIPSSSQQDPISIQAASSNLTADMEYAQAETVSNPADPTVVMFDAPSNKYWLAKSSAPTQPIDRPGAPAGTKYEVDLNDLAGNSRLDLVVEGVGSYVRFDAMGRLDQTSDIVVTISNDAGRVDIMIDAESGSVSAMSDASETATITPAVFTDPSMQLRHGDDEVGPPAPAEETSVPTGPDSAVVAAMNDAADAVDALMRSTTPVTSTTTATINGVVVGITSKVSGAGSVVESVTNTVETTTTTTVNTVKNLLGGGK